MVADIVNLSLATVNDKLIRKYKAYGQELYFVTEEILASYKAINSLYDKKSLQLVERKIAVFRLAMNMDLKGDLSLNEIADQLNISEGKDFKSEYIKMLLRRAVRYVRLNAGDEYRRIIGKIPSAQLPYVLYYGIVKKYNLAFAELIASSLDIEPAKADD